MIFRFLVQFWPRFFSSLFAALRGTGPHAGKTVNFPAWGPVPRNAAKKKRGQNWTNFLPCRRYIVISCLKLDGFRLVEINLLVFSHIFLNQYNYCQYCCCLCNVTSRNCCLESLHSGYPCSCLGRKQLEELALEQVSPYPTLSPFPPQCLLYVHIFGFESCRPDSTAKVCYLKEGGEGFFFTCKYFFMSYLAARFVFQILVYNNIFIHVSLSEEL